MVALKTSALNLRVHPYIKAAIQEAAMKEHRSVASMVEQLIRTHCQDVGISIPEQQSMFNDPSDE